MKVATPIQVALPPSGIRFAESVHTQDFRMAERADRFHKVIYVLDGAVDYLAPPQRPAEAARGSVIFIPTGRRHRLVDRVPATVLLLCFNESWLRRQPGLAEAWRQSLGRAPAPRRIPTGSRPRLEGWFRRALFEQKRDHPYAPALIAATAVEILAEISRLERLPSEPGPADRVHAVAAEIAASLIEPWTIERAAARAGLSRRGFTEHFRQTMGTTFWDYLELLRMDHAARLLREGEHTLLGVMFSCGFNDTSTFYRAFKRRHGQSPKLWALSRR